MAAITDAMQAKIDKERGEAFNNGLGFGALAMLLLITLLYVSFQWFNHHEAEQEQERYNFRNYCYRLHGYISSDSKVCLSSEDNRILLVEGIEGRWK